MAKMDIKTLLSELNNEMQQFTVNPGKWVDFLGSASWNYKYSFLNQLLIYSQRPDATACADFNVWNTRLHRYIAKGSKGIAILNDIGDKVSYVFDVSDTRSKGNEALKLWKIQDVQYSALLDIMNLEHSFTCVSVEDAIVRQITESVDNMGSIYLPEGDVRENKDFVDTFNSFVKYSCCVSVLLRCGFKDAADTYGKKYLENIADFLDADEKIIALGTAVSSISEVVLREIEHDVKTIDKKNLLLNMAKENVEVNNDGNDIQTSRGVSGAGDYSKHDGTVDREDREDGDVEIEISSSQQADSLRDTSDEGRVGEAPDGNRGDGEFTEATNNSELVGRESGADEDRESDGLGSAYELNSVDGGGNGEEGIDLPLDDVLFPSVEEQLEIIEEAAVNSNDFELSQADIDSVLVHGSGFVHGKYRIYDYFLEKHTAKEKAEFLKGEYGLGGGTRIFSDGTWGDSWADAKGLSVSKKGGAIINPDILLSWMKVQKRIGELIKSGQYLNEKELAEYPGYKAELELKIARIEISKEFTAVVTDYNDYLRENNNGEGLLDQYILIVGCASEFASGGRKTNLRLSDGEFVLPLMRDALNEIASTDTPFKERAVNILASLQGDVIKSFEISDSDFEEENENNYVSMPIYKVGDIVFNGATKYSIVEMSESSVYLSDVEFELNSLDMSKEDFEKVILENPSNNHLVKKVPVEEYNSLINHAITVIDEVEKSLLPEDEPSLEVVDVIRVGDFFEVRGEHAERVAKSLELVLTSRDVDGERVPMVGFPVPLLDSYNEKLVGTNLILKELAPKELSDVSEVVEKAEDNSEVVKRNSLVARNYEALNRLAPGILNGDYEYLRFESAGFEPLTVEKVGNNLVSVMHSFVQNGDVMRDPDIVLLVDNKNKTVSAASYEMSAIGSYEEYIDFGSYEVVNSEGQKSTNRFFRDWMKNIEHQGYVLARGITRDGDEVHFDAEGDAISEEVYEGLKEKYQVRLYRPYADPDTVKAYVAPVNTPLERGHIVENVHEVYESREAAENAVENFDNVFDFDEEYRESIFNRIPEPILHRYYSTQRPVGPGTYPQSSDYPVVNVVNYDERVFVEEIDRGAWGYIEFERPLSLKQAEDYELVKAPFVEVEVGEKDVASENEKVQTNFDDTNKNVERGVGEFTGEYIFGEDIELHEGDIVEYTVKSLTGNSTYRGVIEWNESYNVYVISFEDLALRFLSQETHNIRKVGSIYKNAELNEVRKNELSYDEEAYKIGYGSLGNGTTVWNSTDIDKDANDYRTIAHISDDGTVKFYVNDLPEGVKAEIKDKAISFSADYISDVVNMTEERFKYWYFNEMLAKHPSYIPGKDFNMSDYIHCYNALHSDGFVRDVDVSLIVQLENLFTNKLTDVSKETRQDVIDMVSRGEISKDDVSAALKEVDSSKIKSADDVYEVLASKFVDDVSVPDQVEKVANFKISDYKLGVGGPKEKYRNNVVAIKLLNQLESDGRQATADEQVVLSKYVGWGGLDAAFDVNNDSWANEYKELQELLTSEEYRSAKASTLSSFYTQPVVINAIYDGLRQLGFKRGNVLEPSCGVGNFFGMLPDEFSDSTLYGVEIDSISGRIAKQLYPNAKIAVKGYEDTNFKDGFFDVAIGNVPFGQFKVNDKEYNKLNYLIHDYFFAKTLDKVRPGGVIAFITSKGTMDKQSPEVRKYIAQRAELLGAIRLPNDTFTANAGTKATSDIIFLKKRDKAIEIEPDWVHLTYATDKETGEILENEKGELGKINSYFSEHPEMILGNMKWVSGPHGAELTCVPIPRAVLSEQLDVAIKNIQGKISSKTVDFDEAFDTGTRDENDLVVSVPADPDVRNFSYTLVDDEIYYRLDNEMIKQELNPTREKRVRGLIEIRDCLRHLIDLQRYNYSDFEIEAEQSKLNKLYDAYTEKYGLINSRGNSLAFQDDNSYYLLCSLENIDEKTGELISKADMFYKRTIKKHVPVTSVDTPSEALAVSISEKARVDLDYMSDLCGLDKDKVVEELAGVIYQVPGEYDENDNDVFVTSDEYLSGDVRDKLRTAKIYAEEDSRFKINVAALEQVIPKDLEPHEISLRLGSIWIPNDIINEFMWELLETPDYSRSGSNAKKAFYNEVNGSWSLSNKDGWDSSVLVNSTYGTDRINAYNIIYNTLNLKTVEIYDSVETADGKKTRVRNVEETIVAQQKQEAIKNKFLEWVWTDPERRQRLVRIYNDKFNNIRPREYSGEHLVFEGINPEITLMEHQRGAVAHAIYGGNTLLAHEVGAGKTFEMIAIAMESKRLGLCSKSMMVVPNHLIGQWASDFYQLYPSANLLVATKKDFEPANRKKFCSRIATGDYDAVIIGHSQFEKIPLSLDIQERFIQEELDEVEKGIQELKWANGDNASVKSLEKTRKNLENKLEKLQDIEQDNVVTFEELGVDRIFIDEAHYFKNLFLYTKMRNIAGISQTEAKKSSDLFMKTRYLDEITDSRGVVFATGTPISNSMTEAYTMQRYLQYNTLKNNGFSHFDAWASTFGEVVTAVELSPEGTGYRAKERFAKFHNIPEFMSYFKMMADIKTGDELNLPKPEVEFHVVQAQPTELQEQIVQSLGERASKVRGGGVDSKEDNMLKITNDGRLLGLDQRCYDETLPDDENSKVNLAVENIFNIWEKHKDEKLAQLVFCDLSTPNNGKFSVYEDVKQKLIAKGVPEEEIAFIHDANTDTRKENLFSDVRSGNVRILMGSTQKMGAGTNVQNKLIALHDLDCPWRPSDLEQRLGRILRQGNEQDKVDVYRYVTQGTFDAYLWQLVENKQKFISQIMTSKSPVRVAEDIDDTALSYAEIKSLCIKDPRIQEKMELDIDVAKLKVVKGNFMSQKYRLEDNIAVNYPKRIKNLEQSIKGYNEDIKTVQEQSVENGFTPMIVNGKVYNDSKEAGKVLQEACKGVGVDKIPVGSYKGLNMFVYYEPFTAQRRLVLKGALSHEVVLTKVPSRNIELIDDEVNTLNEKLEGCKVKLEETKKNLETAKIEVKKEFPQEEELKSKLARLEELNVLLNNDNEEKDNHLDFKINGDWLVNYRGMGGNVIVPDNVIGISGDVFRNNNLVESVVIPESVTSINYGAFANCKNLTYVEIPDKLLMDSDDDFISNRFKGCPVAEKLEARKKELNSKRPPFQIENGILVKYWGNDKDIIIPDGVKEIGNSVFMGNDTITSVVIPDGVEKIGSFAFDDCFELTSIQIPDSVKEIGYYAFQRCKKLTDVKLPNGLTSIDSHLFWGCKALNNLVIPDSVTDIASGAFSYCDNLANVSMSDDLLKFIGNNGSGDNMFYGCPCLEMLKDKYDSLMQSRSLLDKLADATERSQGQYNATYKSKNQELY